MLLSQYPDVTGVTFRDISGFNGYCVGDDGSVWSCRSKYGMGAGRWRERPMGNSWHKLHPGTHPSGHTSVVLMRNCRNHSIKVHRLVLEAFIGPCPEGMEACHGPNGPSDNSLSNLRWDTRSENGLDRFRFGEQALRGERCPNSKLSQADVDQIRAATVATRGDGAITALAERYGISRCQIRNIRTGRQWKDD